MGFNPNARPGQPDYGLLYIGVGDGGNTIFRNGQVDELHTAQNLMSPLGKILRINPLQDGRWQYGVPRGNPLVNDAQVLGAIWAYGLRNPARFSWDTAGKGKMMIADIGQARIEEINVGVAGANYGWSQREGTWVVDHRDERISTLPNTCSTSKPVPKMIASTGRSTPSLPTMLLARTSLMPSVQTFTFGRASVG